MIYNVTLTHNPQDFFNGIEPEELSIKFTTKDFASIEKFLGHGYIVIIDSIENNNDLGGDKKCLTGL